MRTTAPGRPATRCWTLVTVGGSHDVEVSALDGARLAELLPGLADLVGEAAGGLWSGSTRLPPDTDLRSPALVHGAVLGAGRPGPRPGAQAAASALCLDVVGGPDAGRSVPLSQGRHLVGRGSTAQIAVADPDVSRRHVVVTVAAGRVTAQDAGSANGSRIDGTALDGEPRELPPGALLGIGSTTLAVRAARGARLTGRPAAGGRVLLQPVAAPPARRPDVEVRFPAPPAPPVGRRLAWAAIALPALAGVVGAWLFGSPTFLFFAALGPLVALGTWSGDRWSGRRRHRRDTAGHTAALAAARTRLDAAVATDRRSGDQAAPDLAQLVTAVRRRSTPLWERRGGDPGALAVRLGRGPGATRVTRVESDGTRTTEPCEDLPVTADLALTGGLAVCGPRPRALGVVRAVLVQACALVPPGDLAVAVLTTADRLADWRWLRWLPHVDPADVRVRPSGTADEGGDVTWLEAVVARRTGRPLATGRPGAPATVRLVVVLDRLPGRRLTVALRDARDAGVLALAPTGRAQEGPAAVLRVVGETGQAGVLDATGAAPRPLVVDHLSAAAAAGLARDLAPLATPAGGEPALPAAVRLLDLLPPGAAADGGQGWSRRRDRLVAVLGRSADGVVAVDLCRDGPHALVAGTTGSGKSELLQSLIAGLALDSSPDRCSFLLVDYKGGAAFAEAAHLPHTVGLLTDLDAQTTVRALRSLGAELTRREAVLAAAGVADVTALPDEVDLARLVIVVDEFAGLAEELPDFVPGLVAIAQRGRSLGVHLVLATQRPAGVVSPEIRANCSLRLCLRTTDESDSRDVLGTGVAASLPAHRPGRAYLRLGAADPVLLQVARVSGRPSPGPAQPRVRRWEWPSTGPETAADTGTGPTDLARVAAALAARADRSGLRRPHRPWCPPLPDRLPAAQLTGDPAGRGPVLALGLVDRPDRQTQDVLALDLARGGGWLAVGGPASGRTTLLRTVLAEAVAVAAPDLLHVHVLDHDGGALARAAAVLPHTGTTVGADDPLRTVRLVDRLGAEVAARRASGRTTPHLLVLVDGVEALSAQLDDADPGRGSTALVRLVREGGAAGLTCVLTADRAVPGGRLAAAVGTRLVLPLPDRADYGIAGVPARAVPGHRPPGRALMGEAAVECQLALPRPLPAGAARPGGPRSAALRIPELAPDPQVALPRHRTGACALRVPLGPGGDEGHVLTVDLARSGGLLVAGPPASGRSAVLAALTTHLSAAGVPVLHVTGRGRATAGGDAQRAEGAGADGRRPEDLRADDAAGWAAWVDRLAGEPGVVAVDDHATVADSPVLVALGTAPPRSVALVVAGAAGDLAGAYRGPVAALRRRRSGLLLCPGPGDGDLLGVRLPRTPVPVRPGSGWLVESGVPQRVQVALRRTAEDPS
ncbi:FtsK/SpoIIIE domain-containing protein [Trujillonella humicola]|uniref:FtsK/SpoIIIE domain-containing protein n=1 Tax=Trujillonella humicola TaxID=3383699 RepID=UPI00390644EB